MTHDLLQPLQRFISFNTAVHIHCQQYTDETNKGFVQTGIYRCQLCKRTRISDSDSATTESDDGAEESEIPVAYQGVEACEELEQKKKGTGN